MIMDVNFSELQRAWQTVLRAKPYYASALPLLTLLAAIATAVLLRLSRRHPQPSPVPPKTTTLHKAAAADKKTTNPPREWGKWTPSNFIFPTPEPYPSWSLTDTKPLPYRPFRYGPKYHVTMGLRSVPLAEWIELDNEFPRYHATKARRIQERGAKCCRTAPEALPAAWELLSELGRYLPGRYPGLYRRRVATVKGGDGGKEVVVLENLWSGEKFQVEPPPAGGDGDEGEWEDPMQTCARLVQDDLVIMTEREDGQYYLTAGAVLLPGFWRLEDKFGMPLSEIHTSGDVPQFREKLERGMVNLFRRLKPEEMVGRNNYFFQVDDDLAWSWSIGSEDREEGDGKPASQHSSWGTAEKNRAIEHHYFRSERQTLRRLPKTGGVVFTIRTYFHPVTEIAEEDYVPGRLASAVRSWGDDVSRYKGRERYGDVLLEYLDRKHEEQVRRGLDLSREDEVRAYPY